MDLSLQGALAYWGNVEKLPSLVKSMHQKRPMQVKYGSSTNAKTHQFGPSEVAKYHLAWVNYAPTSGKYNKATYSQHHLCLHTFLQKNPEKVLKSPEPEREGSWWPVVLLQRPSDADFEDLTGLDFPHHLLVSGPGGRLLGLGDEHPRVLSHEALPCPFLVLHRVRAGEFWVPVHSPVPFLVLHRVRAGEGSFDT